VDGLARAIRLRVPSLPDELAPLDAARGPEAEMDAPMREEVAASLLCDCRMVERSRSRSFAACPLPDEP
jgi:hypothetical protein